MSDPAHRTPRPPRVAFLVLSWPSRTETFVRSQIEGLLERGFRVEVIAWNPPGREPDVTLCPVHHLNVPSRAAARYLRAIGQAARRFPCGAARMLRLLALRLSDRTTPFVDAAFAAAFLLRTGRTYDVLHAQFGQLGPTAATLRRTGFHRGAVVTSFRGYDLSQFLRERGRDVYDRLFEEGDRFLPVCERFAEKLRELSRADRRIVVHRSGVDLAKFPFAPPTPDPDGPLRLLCVGRLVAKKGQRYAIGAVERLGDRDVTLDLIGTGPLREELEAVAREAGLGDRVRFLGERTHEEVRAKLARSHVLLALSTTSDDGDEEGIPNTLKEAMATGLPVIGTRHSGIPELIEDGVSGFLVPERDAAAAADRVRHLADHPETWGPIGVAARRRIEEEYDGTAWNDALADLYRELIDRAGS